MDLEFFLRLIGIVLIDLTVAGDNALVIAMAVRTLPAREQKIGIFWGAFGAVALRVAITFVAAQILRLPFLQAGGGLLLVGIALKLLKQDSEKEGPVRHGTTLAQAIRIIILADLIMSIDNILAVAAASHGNLFLLLFGLGLSIPIVVWSSSMVARLMTRHPWLIYLGTGILGWVAGEMLIKDPFVRGLIPYTELLKWIVPAFLAVVVVAIGLWWANRTMRYGKREALAR